MARGGKKGNKKRDAQCAQTTAVRKDPWDLYRQASDLAISDKTAEARKVYDVLLSNHEAACVHSLVKNDKAVLLALEGQNDKAIALLAAAVDSDNTCQIARSNLDLLRGLSQQVGCNVSVPQSSTKAECGDGIRIAILSFLFNWPSTAGGIIHTVELARFLTLAGYDVRHFYARFAPWQIGQSTATLPFPSQALAFRTDEWQPETIQRRFREAVDAFDPDYVIITDSWNFKPLLADAVSDYPYILRQQALECLCPLNNLRLLVEANGDVRQCGLHQLATPDQCHECIGRNGRQSGQLHQAERRLAGVGTAEYQATLQSALRHARAVLVLNPLIQAVLAPYANNVQVVTWGMDPSRFPWPWPLEPTTPGNKTTLLMAGVVSEFIKGFHVLEKACHYLWQKRRDFELLVTADPVGRQSDFIRNIGWLSQAELPRQLRAADIIVMPTVAQEGLGRTTVEAMAVGRPVIASRIGGLPFTVQDGATGLLCEPGNAADLATKIETLLDDPERRAQMGRLARQRFEMQFSWPTVIERDYRPLLNQRRPRGRT